MAETAWLQVCHLVASALELPVEQQKAFLDASTATPEVRAEAESLIAAAQDDIAKHLLDGGLHLLAPDLTHSNPPSLWLGRRLGTYLVIGELGEGGMGLVLLGKRADNLYERTVAIKVIRSALAGDEFIRRFRRETRILARLQHPAITSLLDAGTIDENLPYLVMEYVDGTPIHVYAERQNLPLPQVLRLVITLCDALAHAHAKGVVHRDVKPNNILVNAQGELKLLDFGIAGLMDNAPGDTQRTLTFFRAATPAYASPEQIRGQDVTSRTDIYSVGVVLYFLLTGSLPFELEGVSPAEIERLLLTGQTTLPSRRAVPRFGRKAVTVLDAVIGRAMHPDPARRYASIDELKEELLRIVAHRRPRVSNRRYLAERWWQRRRSAVRAGALAAVAVLSAAALWLSFEHRPRLVVPPARVAIAMVPIASPGTAAWVSVAAEEALATELASGDQIRVVPSADVAQAMRDLHLSSASAITAQQSARLGQILGAEYLLEVRNHQQPDSQNLQFETALGRAATGQILFRQAASSSVANLEETTQDLAVQVARVLPLRKALTPSPSLLPHSPAAIRAYAEGLQHLRALEPVPARAAFQQAIAIEGSSSLAHAALARTWDMLGYRQKAMDEAEHAMALDAALPVRSKLVVEAQTNEIRHQWAAAIAAYKTLRDYDPDEVEYVLGLARCQLASNQGDTALRTLRGAEKMPSLLGADPRIELLASTAEESLGKHADALKHADMTLAAGRERGATQLMAQAQSARASALESLGKVDLGMAAAQEAQTLFARAGDTRGKAVNLIATGNFLEDHARYAEAKASYLEAKSIFAQTGDEAGEALAENDLGIVADDLGDPQEALTHYTGALQTFRRVGNQVRIPLELNNIGIIQKELHRLDAAKRSYREALHLLDEMHDTRRVAQEYNNLGFICIEQGTMEEAEQDFQKAFTIYSASGQIAGTIYASDGRAHVAWIRGRLQEAHAHYQEAILIARRVPEIKQVALALRADAHVLHDAGDEDNARRELKESQDLRDTHHEVLAAAEGKLSAINFDLDAGRSIQPDSRFTDLLAVFAAKSQDIDTADTQLFWTASLLLQGKTEEAVKHLRLAAPIIHRLHNHDLDNRYLVAAARVAAAQGHTQAALATLRRCLSAAVERGDQPARMNLYLEIARVLAAQSRRHAETSLKQYAAEAKSRNFMRVATRIAALANEYASVPQNPRTASP